MSKNVTFLQLSQEFGGTRFGPFHGVEIRLGADPGRNDITLPEALGVAPEHVKILRQSDGSFILAPVDRTAAVYFWRAGATKPKQLTTPMAVQGGDGFSLVTAEGPRFYIAVEIDRAAIEAAAKEAQGPGSGVDLNAKGRGILKELKRVGVARFFTTKIGHVVQNGWRLIVTGQIFSPMYIVMGMTMFSGWLFAGGAACTALSFNKSKGDYQQQLTNCRDQLGVGNGPEADPTVPSLTTKILIDRTWASTVENDQDLYKAYAENLKVIFSDPDRYKWVYTQKGSEFDRFKKALEATGMPENLVRVVAYTAAIPSSVGTREWGLVVDSDDEEVCGRGPLNLTYAQAWRLGLTQVQMDAFVDRNVASSNDLEKQAEALRQSASRIDAPTELDQDLIRSAGAQLQGGAECLYLEGDDHRKDVNELASAIQRVIGSSASGLPRESEQYWIASRLVKLYSLDFTRPVPEELKFDARQAPSTAMTLAQVKASRKGYAVNQAAAVIARAVAIPCLAALDKDTRRAPPTFLWELPNLGSCAIVKAFVEYDQL